MDQISLFSAEASRPAVADLAGVLCGPGQITSFARTAARLSVVVDERLRADVLAAEYRCRGVSAEVGPSECGRHLVWTAFRVDLIALATGWNAGSAKTVPDGFRLDGGALRMWALAAGRRIDTGYLLPLDAGAAATYGRLAAGVDELGLAGKLLDARCGGPGVRVAGRRRLERLAELLGGVPAGAEELWPLCPEEAEAPDRGRTACPNTVLPASAVLPSPAVPVPASRDGQLDLLSA